MKNNHISISPILKAYEQLKKSQSWNIRFAFVSGYLGMGKTTLVQQFKEHIQSEALIIEGNFNAYHQGIPYHGFKQAISNHVHYIITNYDRGALDLLERNLIEKLGNNLSFITDYIPELSLLLKDPMTSQQQIMGVENQLYPLIKTLLDIFISFSHKPCVFILDNLQWIDPSSTNLLKYLAFNTDNHKIFVLGAYRKNEVQKGHPINLLLKDFMEDTIQVTELEIKHMTLDDIQILIKQNFPNGEVSASLSETVLKLTEGHPFYVHTLLKELRDSKLIWLKDGVWEANQREIYEQYGQMNMEGSVLQRLNNASLPTQKMLEYIACIGYYHEEVIQHLLHTSSETLQQLIQEAVQLQLIQKEQKSIRFPEGYFADIIYKNIPLHQREMMHFLIAETMFPLSRLQEDTSALFYTTQQYNEALPIVIHRNKFLFLAQLNLQAGNAARENRAFELAIKFYNTAADLLKETTSKDEQTTLKTEIQLEKATCEYRHGNYDLSEIHLDKILQYTTDPVLRSKAYEQKIVINIHTTRFQNAIDITQEALRELGTQLPVEEKELSEALEVQNTNIRTYIQEYGIDHLYDYHQRELTAQEDAILRILYASGVALQHYSSKLLYWQSAYIVNLSLSTKMTTIGCMGLIIYGRMLITFEDDFTIAFALSSVGYRYNNSLPPTIQTPRINGAYAYYILSWQRPYREAIPLLEESIQSAIGSGDEIGVQLLKGFLFNLKFIAGFSLQTLIDNKASSINSLEGKGMPIYKYPLQLILYLSGNSATLSSPGEVSRHIIQQQSDEEQFFYHHIRSKYYFLMDMYEAAMEEGELGLKYSTLQKSAPLYVEHLFFLALAIAANFVNISKNQREHYIDELKKYLEKIEFWEVNCKTNQLHRSLLLKAELLRLEGNNTALIKEAFQKAIKQANIDLFPQNKGIAHLRLFNFLLSQREANLGREELFHAINAFQRWGAKSKVLQLEEKYTYLLPLNMPFKQNMLSLEAIQQEISTEISEEKALKKLLTLLLTSSAASRCVIFLKEKNDLVFSGEADAETHQLSVSNATTYLKDYSKVPHSTILYCARTLQIAHSSKPLEDDLLREKDYIKQYTIQAYLCIPIVINNELTGVIYFENYHHNQVFNDNRSAWIKLIAKQGGLHLEKAKIHQQTLRLNTELKQEMAEKEQLHKLIEEQKSKYLAAIVETQEKERKRIAEDLHDSLGALLGSVKMLFTHLQDPFEQNVEHTKAQEYIKALQLLDDACQEVRRISHNMLPSSLTKFGLITTLSSFVDQVQSSSGLEINFQAYGFEDRLPSNIEVAVYRICLELLQNINKHAKAKQIDFQLMRYDDSLNISIEDDGIGFDLSHKPTGIGLENIASRVDYLKGSYQIDSRPGYGTSVMIDIPLVEASSES
ncbi:AAA family ATPase [Algivirga pacifica]|uniref:Histidine kinase domain-containing protein n=1 Tax=Algivirga pacifica TaxID=1162670 RepID=A0ABP9DLP4_9BACT